METNFIIAQIIGIAVAVISVVMVQFKNMAHILLLEIISNLLISLNFILLGGWSGSGICIIAIFQTTLTYIYNKKGMKLAKGYIILFEILYLICSVFTYKNVFDIISCGAALLYGVAIVQKKTSNFRMLSAINSILWIIFDIGVCAYTTVFTHGFLLVSIIIAMIRLDLKKKQRHETVL